MTSNILDDIDLRHLGELLSLARKKCGMTQAESAKIIDVARTTIVAIEKGERRIKANELIKLASAYGQSVNNFVKPRPVVDYCTVQFRTSLLQLETENSPIKASIERWQELCQNYLELEEIMDAPLPRNYPPEYDVSNIPIEAAAEYIATGERQRLGLGDNPIPQLRDILEQTVGLRIFYLKMPSKYSGFYAYDDRIGGCIAINSNHYEERQLWSMSHEYLHFLAHRRKPIVDYENQFQRMPESEKIAEAFPKYFLMPKAGIFNRFHNMVRAHDGKFSITNLFILAHYYGVSIESLVYRLEEMKLLPFGTLKRLKDRGLKSRKIKQELGLNEDRQRPDMMPIYYQYLAIGALDRGSITEGQFANFLGVDRLESRIIAESLREHCSGIIDESVRTDLRLV
jgi:Zn-dependent peptidase ImmA (M78 family)/DNA-binding XRE family transcriptional regulator